MKNKRESDGRTNGSAPEPAPRKRNVNRKPVVLMMRGNRVWKVWLEELAEAEGDTVAKMVERAIRVFARGNGYEDPPRR